MRETFQGEDRDCPECQDAARLRIAQQPWTNRNNLDDVPIRLRRDSLPQRYIPTPPPAYASRVGYTSRYGYAEDEGRRAADPDPSPREVYRRVADWADHVPAPQATGSTNTRREVELYRSHEHSHSRRAESSSSRHSGVESHVSRSSRHRSNIYDPPSERHPHPRTEDSSSHSSHYMRASDEERRRRYGYPPSLPSVPDGYEISETSIYISSDGTEVTRTSTWRQEYQQQDQPGYAQDTGDTEEQNRITRSNYASSAHRGDTRSVSVTSSSRGPPPQQQQRRLQ
jgi:hypothetical protein